MKRFAWKVLNAVALLLVALGVLLGVTAALALHTVLGCVAVALIAAGFAVGVTAGRALGVRFLATSYGDDEDCYEPVSERLADEMRELNPEIAGSRMWNATHSLDAWKQPSA